MFTDNSWVSLNATTRSRSNGKSPIEKTSSSPHHPMNELMTPEAGRVRLPLTESSARPDPYDFSGLAEGMGDPLPEDSMEPDNISISSISVTLAPLYRGLHRLQISHQNLPLQIQCASLKVRFGINTKFLDHAGRPRLSFVVDAPPSLCKLLNEIDSLAQKTSVGSGSLSEWRTLVSRKPGFFNYPTVRLQ